MSTNYTKTGSLSRLKTLLLNRSKAFMLGLFLLVATAASASVNLLVTGSANVASIQSGDNFIYTINYSVSSFTDIGHNVAIDIVLPASLEITDEGTPSNSVVYDPSQVASVSYNSGSRTLHIAMVEPIPAGSTGQLQVTMRYKNGVTPNGYDPGISTIMSASNSATGNVTSNVTHVTALATNKPTVIKDFKAGGALDNLAVYKITARNGGSSGSLNLNSPVLRDTLPAGVVFVKATKFNSSNTPTTYTIAGGKTVVEWTWPSFLATGYDSYAYLSVKYTSPTFSVGSSVTNCATLSGTVNSLPYITQAAQAAQGCVTFNIAAPTTGGACNGGWISASTAWWMDRHVLAGTNNNGFGNGWYNSGNTELDAVSLTYHIDEAVDFENFQVFSVYDGLDDPAQAQIVVSYKTNLNGYVVYGTYLSLDIYSGATPYTFNPPVLPVGEYVTDMKFDITAYGGSKLPIGGRQDLSYHGIIRTAAQGKKDGTPIIEGTTYNPSNVGDDGTTITNHSEGTYSYNGTTTSFASCDGTSEILSPRPVFYPLTKYTTNGSSFKASDIVNYEARFYVGGNATANNIVIKDTLDARLIYQDGTSEYYNGSSWVAITPTVTALGSQQILTYTIGNVTPVIDEYIRFQAQVKPGTLPGTIPNRLEVTTTTANNLFSGLTDYANVTVISAVALEVKKGQIGNCMGDPNNYIYYPSVAHTLPGGDVKYKITIKNLGNVVAKDFIMYDVFPFTSDYRGSQYFANLATPGTVDDPLSTVYYTTTVNPCMDELVPAITPPGCNTPVWTSVIPVDLTTVTGIKLMRSADLPIFDSISISWNMKAPVGVPFGNIMNNSVSYQVSRADNGDQLLPATPNQVGMVADCINPLGSLGNYVWLDDNQNGLQDEAANRGLNGVKVYLYKETAPNVFTIYDSTITGNDFSGNPGYYVFNFLNDGRYQVKFPTSVLANAYTISPTSNQAAQIDGNNDANNSTGRSGIVTINVAAGGVDKDNPTIDAGYITPVGSLGNYVWYDDNNDGLQNEPTTNGVNGVKVYLYKETTSGSGVYTIFDSTITANDGSGNPGYYNFPNLNSANYKVKFPTAIGNYPVSTPNNQTSNVDGNNDANATGFSGVVPINVYGAGTAKDNPTIDAGYRTNIGSLGNYVWRDFNGNGLQDDALSYGFNGVKVYLLNGAGTKIDSTITTNDGSGNPGYYNFPNLNSGNYQVLFPTIFAGYPLTPIVNQAMQVDGNQDADFTTGKSGVVTINTNSNNPLDVNNPTIDAGYGLLGTLGNYVWYDDNNNGIQDEPTANGVNGVKVILYKETTPGSGVYVKYDSTTTANDGSGNPGYYNFKDLFTANYKVQFPTMIGNYPISDVTNQAMQVDGNNDANKTTGFSGVVAIDVTTGGLNRDNPTIDAGYRTNIGSLGNYVWYDVDGNGLQNEPASNGINGIKVYLLNGSGNKIDSTITANDGSGNPGYYNFPNLNSGNYQVQFPTTSGGFPITSHTPTAQTDGNSDANVATGKSPVVAIITNSSNPLDVNNPTIDAGYVPIGTLGNYVWYDANKNGLQDEPSANGLNDIKVILWKETTPGVYVKVDSMLTRNDSLGKSGWYTFYNLVKGNYKVQFPTSEGSYYLTPTNNQAPQVDGNNDAGSNGFSGIVSLNPLAGGLNRDNPTIDAGYYCDCNGFKVDIVINKTFDCLQGNSFTFSANINRTGGKYFYSWDFGDGTTSTLANPTHTYATAGEYDVKLTVVENSFCGCRYEASVQQVYVGPKPVVNFDWQYNGNCLTYDFNSTSTVTMGWIAGFFWDFGNGTTSTQSNPLATFATAGTYNVKLVITSNYGCKDSIIFPVNIINKCTTTGNSTGSTGGGSGVTPTPCSAGWWSQNATSNCDSTLQFNVSNTTTGATYAWDFGDGNTGTGNPATHKYAAPGSYSVKLVVSKSAPSACADSLTYNIYISNCAVSGGGGSGLESKTLGDVLAVRLFGNAINSKVAVDGIKNGVQFNNSGIVVNGVNDISLNSLIPSNVTGTDIPYVSTPTDLVNFTNAVEVLAVDYTKNSNVKAVAFGTKTLGDVYAHTKPICDRLKGAELLEVKTINVNGFNLMAYKVRQRTGEIEFAMNLSAGIAANRNTISLQSNWFTDSYVQDEKLFNFQLWSVSYDMTKSMAQDIISKLQANGSINVVTLTDLPKAYISKGSRVNTNLNLTIKNNTTATNGYFELKEKANETMSDLQITTRQIPFTVNANGTSNITIPVKDNYEGNIYVYLNNKLTDLVYLADGTWSIDYNKQNTTISKFNVTNESTTSSDNTEYRLMRKASVSGTTKDYITVYKTMMGGGLEQNVSNYKSLLFNANAIGAGSVKVTLIKKSITNYNEQYTYTLSLDGNGEYAINLNQFKSSKYADVINANDITAVSFSFSNSRGVTTTMSIDLSKVRFSTSSSLIDNTLSAISVYPNPAIARFVTTFNSDKNQNLVLKVIEVATGRVVKTQFVMATKGLNKQTVELNNTVSGNYIVSLEGDDIKYNTTKVVVSK